MVKVETSWCWRERMMGRASIPQGVSFSRHFGELDQTHFENRSFMNLQNIAGLLPEHQTTTALRI